MTVSQTNNSLSSIRQSISLSPHYTLFYSHSNSLSPKKIPSPYIYPTKNNLENARTKSREKKKKKKSISSYVIVHRNSSKKLESLDQSGILLGRNNNCDVIKGVHSNPLAWKKGLFFLNQLSKFFAETRITRTIWNRIMSYTIVT